MSATQVVFQNHQERREWAQSMRDAGHTLESIGDALGVTRERVRQITKAPPRRGNLGTIELRDLMAAIRDRSTDSVLDAAKALGVQPETVRVALEGIGVTAAAQRLFRWRKAFKYHERQRQAVTATETLRARLGRDPRWHELWVELRGLSAAEFRGQALPLLLRHIFGNQGSSRSDLARLYRLTGISKQPRGQRAHVAPRGLQTRCHRGHTYAARYASGPYCAECRRQRRLDRKHETASAQGVA